MCLLWDVPDKERYPRISTLTGLQAWKVLLSLGLGTDLWLRSRSHRGPTMAVRRTIYFQSLRHGIHSLLMAMPSSYRYWAGTRLHSLIRSGTGHHSPKHSFQTVLIHSFLGLGRTIPSFTCIVVTVVSTSPLTEQVVFLNPLL